MAWASVSYIFSPSTVIRSSEVNQNFSDLVAGLDKAMPSGGIIIWSGAIVDVPSGWYLCDGNNGTPNLRDRFVVGAGSTYAVGDTGGAETHTLTLDEIPAHNHGGGNHSHGVTDPGHAHSISSRNQDGSSNKAREGDPSGGGGVITNSATTGISIQNSGTIISTQGGGLAHNNLPPYFALAYIMKS